MILNLFARHLSPFILLFLFVACTNDSNVPEGYQKLSEEELLEMAGKKELPSRGNILYIDEEGREVQPDSLARLGNMNDWAGDMYEKEGSDVYIVVLRQATADDEEFRRRMDQALQQTELEKLSVNCDEIAGLLAEVEASDQQMRQAGNIDPEVDRMNLSMVVSLIETCGMPGDPDQVRTVWLVLQHADPFHRAKYFPLLEEAVENGLLESQQLAMMEDRIRLDNQQPQRYGTQVVMNQETGEWQLYELEDPENVEEWRAAVGLGPLKEYLSQFGVEYDEP